MPCPSIQLIGSAVINTHGAVSLTAGIVADMSLVESIERGLDWLAAPKRLPGRLEMETQRGRRLELEVVSFTVRAPVGGVTLKIPVFMMVLPRGTSPGAPTNGRPEARPD